MIKLQTTLFILFLLVTQGAFSQLDDGMVSDDCITVQTIEVPFSDAQFVTNSKNNQNYNLVYYGDNDEYTFWYKLIITENCALQFDVEPSTPGDDYDFMLYKFTSTNFCEAMVDNLILPLNETQYSSKSNSEYPNQSSITSSSRNIKVKAGETYYISVMNIYGEDCGHRLSIDACGSSVVLNSVHKPCFIFSQPSVAAPVSSTTSNAKNRSSPSSTSDKLANQGDTIIVDDFVSIDGVVRDNDNGHPINAKLTFVDEVNGNTFYAEPNAFNGYQLNLERGRRYQITCEAFGYYPINGVIEFLKPSTYDFYLLKIKEGKTFILSEILFYPSTYALKDDSYTELDKLVNYMTKNPMLKIQIEGHTAEITLSNKPNPNMLL